MSDSAISFVINPSNNSANTIDDDDFENEKFLASVIYFICSAVVLLVTFGRACQGWYTRKDGFKTWIRSMDGSSTLLMLFAGILCTLQTIWAVVGERILQWHDLMLGQGCEVFMKTHEFIYFPSFMCVYALLSNRQRFLYEPRIAAYFSYPNYLNILSKCSLPILAVGISSATAFFYHRQYQGFNYKFDKRSCYTVLDSNSVSLDTIYGIFFLMKLAFQGLILILTTLPLRILCKEIKVVKADILGHLTSTKELLMNLCKNVFLAFLVCVLSDMAQYTALILIQMNYPIQIIMMIDNIDLMMNVLATSFTTVPLWKDVVSLFKHQSNSSNNKALMRACVKNGMKQGCRTVF